MNRQRHLKCDETKPACARCLADQWACEYLAPKARKRKAAQALYPSGTKSLSIYRPCDGVSDDAHERHCFYVFRDTGARDSTSYFEPDAWQRLVLRCSHSEPALLHSACALGSLLQAHIQRSTQGDSNPLTIDPGEPRARFGLHQYNKAVKLLARGLSVGETSENAALLCCLLFVWIEFLQQDLDAALRHLQSGLKIIECMEKAKRLEEVDACVHRVFLRLQDQATFHGSPTSEFNNVTIDLSQNSDTPMPSHFVDVAEARTHLSKISGTANRSMRAHKQSTASAKTVDITVSSHNVAVHNTVNTVVHKLGQWQHAFENSLLLDCRKPTSTELAARCLLRMQYLCANILSKAFFSASEMQYDNYTPEFTRIVSLAKDFLQHARSLGFFGLSIDSGIIPPLGLVAFKCRQLSLRLEAIELLRQAPAHEGVWQRDSVIKVAEWKLSRENKCQASAVPESARIHALRSGKKEVDGKTVTVIRFKDGRTCCESPEGWYEEPSDLPESMGDLL